MKTPLTTSEEQVADHLTKAWDLFHTLRQTHPDDLPDFKAAIHTAQRIMGMRELRRDYPDTYPSYDKDGHRIY